MSQACQSSKLVDYQASHPAMQLSQAEAERLTSLQKRLQAHEDRAGDGGTNLGGFPCNSKFYSFFSEIS